MYTVQAWQNDQLDTERTFDDLDEARHRYDGCVWLADQVGFVPNVILLLDEAGLVVSVYYNAAAKEFYPKEKRWDLRDVDAEIAAFVADPRNGKNGFPPTNKRIAEALGLTESAVQKRRQRMGG